ncbi:MAG: tyrosine--tRNA ligase [Bacilli bacterium]|nr:tyrosine--tRNA ligase [Bacilli bacterium]
MNLYEDLMYRGLIKDVASENLEKVLNGEPISFYWGTDPTASSLHIGHYSSLITAKRLAKAGHHPILLVGGATGLIGDPRPTAEREIISKEIVEKNIEGIKKQVSAIVGGDVEVVNNYDWFKDISWIDFLRDTGKYININYMLDKDIIRRRLETGITFAEFAYTLMQGYDFEYLYENKNVTLQCAGSDQWGNITTGVDLIQRKLGKSVSAFTMPLILDESGNKFGKSEGNALWLDKNLTSSYKLFQYLINTADSKVEEYLKVYTFLSKEQIEDVMKRHNEKPEERIAQRALAKEFITDLHGSEEYEKAEKISKALFTDQIYSLSKEDILGALDGVPTFIIADTNILDVLVNGGICSSKREAREMVSGNAISINNNKITDLEYEVTPKDAIDGEILVLKKGKRNYYIGNFKQDS